MKNFVFILFSVATFFAQEIKKEDKKREPGHTDINKFSQLYNEFATPNMFRTGSGAPGPAYYQQRADYKMAVILDDKSSKLTGTETITYYNNSPDQLEFLWLQLDQNIEQKSSIGSLWESESMPVAQSPKEFVKKYSESNLTSGYSIEYVKDAQGIPMKYTINQTMMRIDLSKPLKKGEIISFSIKWAYNILDYMNGNMKNGRNGYELLADGNKIYIMAQFFPRMCVYNDVEGWQNHQFTGRSEFALNFGNYDVSITVPSDHILDGTGEILNKAEVYTPEQLKRWTIAENTFDKPIIIVTDAEATAKGTSIPATTKTWKFKAENVRDFAFSSSRRFIVDAMAVKVGSKKPMAISMYPKEANPLWGDLSTKAVAHTLSTYSRFTFDYPYPKAISVSAEDQGMEYPMICWNFGRPDEKGYTPQRTKEGMIGVIVHEVGHNFFPMIVNSDERQWTWMDEGLNSFMDYITTKEFDPKMLQRRGPAKSMIPYMSGDQKYLEPIMTHGDLTHSFSANAYSKPATALNILRETILGHDLFDHAFKTYANRWKFKHPTPEDFFRTMEDASGTDLDWFWRGWFYSTDYSDTGIREVKQFYVSENPSKEAEIQTNRRGRRISDGSPMLYLVSETSSDLNEKYKKELAISDIKLLSDYIDKNFSLEEKSKINAPKYFYEVVFDKPGGLLMPLFVELEYDDNTKELFKYPVEVWRKNNEIVKKIFATQKKVKRIVVDPNEETADIDTSNNYWPKIATQNKFEQLEKAK